MNSDHLSVARQILTELLRTAPQKGAILKPFLIREFQSRTGADFARAFWQYPKFLMFLQANSDLVDVELPQGPGDIIVRLRTTEAHRAGTTPSEGPNSSGSTRLSDILNPLPREYLDAGIWHAFTNPDPKRKRFFNRETHEVLHYVEGSNNPADQMRASTVRGNDKLIEVKPIPPETQSNWMRSFLERNPIAESKRQVLKELASLPYSSQTNRAFSTVLDMYADAWRRYRTGLVIEEVSRWAEQNDLSTKSILDAGEESLTKRMNVREGAPSSGTTPSFDSDMRAMLHAAVDSLDESELGQILLPARVLRKVLAGARK